MKPYQVDGTFLQDVWCDGKWRIWSQRQLVSEIKLKVSDQTSTFTVLQSLSFFTTLCVVKPQLLPCDAAFDFTNSKLMTRAGGLDDSAPEDKCTASL